MKIEIEMPDELAKTHVPYPYFVRIDLVEDYTQCYSELQGIELDKDGKEIYTEAERARQFVQRHMDRPFLKWQEKNLIKKTKFKSGGIR